MIKFFRSIRKKLIEQGKTANYLKYAIGEIVLVVIGILIALQINTWNEVKKTQKFEQETLSLIDQNLGQDSILLSAQLVKAQRAIELTGLLLSEVDRNNYHDSLGRWMAQIICFERFKSQSSAFEVLKSKGIETISNKELQLALISYYDVNLFGVYQSLEDVEQSFVADWIPVIKQDFSDFIWMEYCIPANTQTFLEKPSTSVLFKLYRDNRGGSVRNIDAAIHKISEIRLMTKPYIQ